MICDRRVPGFGGGRGFLRKSSQFGRYLFWCRSPADTGNRPARKACVEGENCVYSWRKVFFVPIRSTSRPATTTATATASSGCSRRDWSGRVSGSPPGRGWFVARVLNPMISRLASRNPRLCERTWAYLVGGFSEIVTVVQAVKD